VVAFQSWEGLARDGVVGPATTAAPAKAQVQAPRASGPSRRIEIYRERSVTLLIAHGRTKRAVHVSAGAPGTSTPAGTFKIPQGAALVVGAVSGLAPIRVVLHAGIAFHEYPDVPVYPASHGCVRVPAGALPVREVRYHRRRVLTTAPRPTYP
jgi:L,D-transpeptidase catalytic domain